MTAAPLRWLAALAPVAPDPDAEAERAVAVAGLGADPETLAAASVGAAVVGVVTGTAAALAGRPALAAACLALGSAAGYACHRGPAWLATVRRTRAVGDVPELVGLAALRARVAPTPEAAAEFAADHGRDPLAASLREHVRRAEGTPRAGWEGFAGTWGAWDPSLRRAVSLLGAAVDADPGDRERLLDRALDVVLTGTRDRTAAFAADVRGPASALYAFGVVLPLALVATLPAARAAGLPVTVAAVVAVFDVALPVVLLASSAWLLARRPAAFPPTPVPRSHPDVPDRRALAVAAAAGGAAVAWVAAGAVAPAWTRWVAAPGVGVGAPLVCWFDPVRRVRRRVRAVEDGLPDAIAFVGQRLQHGESPERAVAAAGRELSGAAADTFETAARVGATLRVGVSAAFLGEAGALADLPSPRVRASAALLAVAANEGGDGGRVLVEMADYVDGLASVEREARRELATVTGTLRSTAYAFAPLVGGATVALAGRVGDAGLGGARGGAVAGTAAGGGAALPVSALGVAVGAYVVVLAAILAGLAAALDRGLDRALVGFHAGAAVACASALYPATVAAAGLLV